MSKLVCPNCNYQTDDDEQFCSKCGEKLISFCQFCGAELKQNATFCSQCGKEQGSIKETPPQSVPERILSVSKKVPIVLIVLILLAISFIIFVLASVPGSVYTSVGNDISNVLDDIGDYLWNDEAREIDKVLSKNHKIEVSIFKIDPNTKEFRERLEFVIRQMKSIDTIHCPQDFRIAYDDLIHSYEEIYRAGRIEAGEESYFSKIKAAVLPDGSGWLYAHFHWRAAVKNVNDAAERHGAKNRLSYRVGDDIVE